MVLPKLAIRPVAGTSNCCVVHAKGIFKNHHILCAGLSRPLPRKANVLKCSTGIGSAGDKYWNAYMSKTQYQKHREARAKLKEIFDVPHSVLFIHYSCESFYDRPNGMSPRITSIAVRFLGSGQTKSFSIYQQAELVGKKSNEITPHYDEYEREMLEKFNKFVEQFAACKWVHWNMRDANYGFEAITHRFRVLGGDPVEIQDTNKIDLARLFYYFLGPKYIPHPRLHNFLLKNDMVPRNFMPGAEEVEAFDNGEYVKLHQSTLSKVDAITNLAEVAVEDRLISDNSYFVKKGLTVGTIGHLVKDHPIFIVMSISTVILALVADAWNVINLF